MMYDACAQASCSGSVRLCCDINASPGSLRVVRADRGAGVVDQLSPGGWGARGNKKQDVRSAPRGAGPVSMSSGAPQAR
eukprot:COSAG02_NODE_49291_length_327_cov_4.311404_1_plen_78_part_01